MIIEKGIDKNSLAYWFGAFFTDKINKLETLSEIKICSFIKVVTLFSSFQLVSESEVLKFIEESPARTCSLDPWPTFLVKRCTDILLPSLTKLVHLSLENVFFQNLSKCHSYITYQEDLSVLGGPQKLLTISLLLKLVERVVV